MNSLKQIRDTVRNCRNADNIGCVTVTKYRDQKNVEGACHPVLFQIVPKARIVIIGAVPGSIDADPTKEAYQKLVNGQFSLGHKSAQGLGEIMIKVGKIKGIDLPQDATRLPDSKSIQDDHLSARKRLGLHVTNLVKCPAPTGWENSEKKLWKQAARACESRYLTHEIEATNPSMIILLGQRVVDYISEKESWDSSVSRLKISAWAQQARYLSCYGRERLVSAWVHPGGKYFWIQGKAFWDSYAEQMAEFIE